MNLIKRWNAFMGPKDERLESESNRCMRVGYILLLAGAGIAAWYGIMVNQVADTTDTPIYTSIGENVFPVSGVITVAILISCLITLGMQMKAGIVDEHVRMATIDHVPWGFCFVIGVISGAMLGVISATMRMLAEIQIVGIENVTWAGDLAMGVVFFVMAFVVGTFGTAAYIKSAIVAIAKQERLLDD